MMNAQEIVRDNLKALAKEYMRHTGTKTLSAVSKKVYGNAEFLGLFFAREQGLTLKKMDEMVAAFQRRWPPGKSWPICQVITFPSPGRVKMSPRKKSAA